MGCVFLHRREQNGMCFLHKREQNGMCFYILKCKIGHGIHEEFV